MSTDLTSSLADHGQAPPILGGRYRPTRAIGRGGMGVVYEVVDVESGDRFALKLLSRALAANPIMVERFRREARVISMLASEHVVRIVGIDVSQEYEGAPFLLMELLEGEDLGHRSARTGAQSPDDVARWLMEAARGLEKAHAQGIVHRDLKPSNLFLARVGDRELIKVLDFGVAKLIGHDDLSTTTGTTLGTPRYMSPEQLRGKRGRIGPASDQWALAMVAFHALAGKNYWAETENAAELVAQVLFGDIEPPSALGCAMGPAFDAWFARSCERDPEKRWPSVIAQAEALTLALEGAQPLSSRAERPVPDAPTATADMPATLAQPVVVVARTSKRTRYVVAIAIALVLGGVGMVIALSPRPVQPPIASSPIASSPIGSSAPVAADVAPSVASLASANVPSLVDAGAVVTVTASASARGAARTLPTTSARPSQTTAPPTIVPTAAPTTTKPDPYATHR